MPPFGRIILQKNPGFRVPNNFTTFPIFATEYPRGIFVSRGTGGFLPPIFTPVMENSLICSDSPYVAIAGNIGSGKSYMTELLSDRLGWMASYEESENPYIGDFYEDMRRWSFNLQVYFLGKRQRQVDSIIQSGEPTVVDRTIYEDACVFAANLHAAGLLSSRDYKTYSYLYDFIVNNLARPKLLIYLRASVPTLISQIQRRGRVYEASIDGEYLGSLNKLYENWIESYDGPKLVVDVDREDFVTDNRARAAILERIQEHLERGSQEK